MPTATSPAEAAPRSSDKSVVDSNPGARDVSIILGIGRAAAKRLARIRAFTVDDLLRSRVDQLDKAMGDAGSPAEAAHWRAAASLLQVNGLTPARVEALIRHDVMTPSELSAKSLSEVEKALASARGDAMPATPDEIAAILRDATVLSLTGKLMGTVRDAKGKPVRNATVALAGQLRRSDRNGRFHCRRVRLGRPCTLTINHPKHATLSVSNPPLLSDDEAVGVLIFTLKALRRGARAAVPGVTLREFDGDVLPVPTGQPMREVVQDAKALRDGDILRYHDDYKSGEAKLVSRFKSHEGGEFLVHAYRVPRSSLPADLARRDHVRCIRGALAPLALDADGFRRELARRRMRRHFRREKIPTTTAGRKAAIKTRLKFLIEQRSFAGSFKETP